jgi:hypothetical protein
MTQWHRLRARDQIGSAENARPRQTLQQTLADVINIDDVNRVAAVADQNGSLGNNAVME